MTRRTTPRRWGRIRKLPSGRFQARYPGPDGQTYSAPHTFPTKTDANIWLNDKEAELRRDGWRDPNGGRELLRDYAARWLTERPGLAPSTVALYTHLERCHVRPGLGGFALEDITPPRVRTWRKGLLDSGTGEVTVAKAYRLLKAILNTAVEEDEVIARNPCRVKGGGKERSPERRVPTINEVYRIAGELPERYKALVLLAAFTGLRWGELMALQRQDLDLATGTVEVRASMAEVGGKLIEGPPKSQAGKRTVAVPMAIFPELRHHLAEWAQTGKKGHVFVTSRGTTPRRSSFGTMWRKSAGTVHFHDLRHLANDMAATIVRNLREQMKFMGHASTDAALRYQHAAEAVNQDVAEGISQRIREAKSQRGHVGGTKPEDGTQEDDGGASDDVA